MKMQINTLEYCYKFIFSQAIDRLDIIVFSFKDCISYFGKQIKAMTTSSKDKMKPAEIRCKRTTQRKTYDDNIWQTDDINQGESHQIHMFKFAYILMKNVIGYLKIKRNYSNTKRYV